MHNPYREELSELNPISGICFCLKFDNVEQQTVFVT